ncbi:MAG: hypothetical protein RSE94_04085 [Pseudomonas sp.]
MKELTGNERQQQGQAKDQSLAQLKWRNLRKGGGVPDHAEFLLPHSLVSAGDVALCMPDFRKNK